MTKRYHKQQKYDLDKGLENRRKEKYGSKASKACHDADTLLSGGWMVRLRSGLRQRFDAANYLKCKIFNL